MTGTKCPDLPLDKHLPSSRREFVETAGRLCQRLGLPRSSGGKLASTVHEYAARYVELPRASLRVKFSGGVRTRILPTDPHSGGPWVMWRGTPYAHLMVPTAAMAKPVTNTKHTSDH